MIYSYFIMWRDSDYFLQRIYVTSKHSLMGCPINQLNTAIENRCKELNFPCDISEDTSIRVFADPSGDDPVLWAKTSNPVGVHKLAGEYPGRAIYRKLS